MRIIYLHQYFNTPEMSGGTRSYEMAKRWVEHGHEVMVVTSNQAPNANPEQPKRETLDGIEIVWLPCAYDNAFGFLARIRSFVRFAILAGPSARQYRGDVVFATSTPLTIIIPAVFATLFRRTPIIFEVRDLWPEMPVASGKLRNTTLIGIARTVEHFAYRRARRIVALSPGIADSIAPAVTSISKIVVAPNACDISRFEVSAETGRSYRRSFTWLGDAPFVVYCGTIGELNDVSFLVTVAAQAARINPQLMFGVYGSGRDAERVRSEAARLAVLNRNLFMMGRVAKRDVPAVLSAATIVTSLFLPIPEMDKNSANKFFDALAASRPVAINYGGWQAELIDKHGLGLVLDPLDPDEAARQLCAIIDDPERLRNAGEAAGHVALRFSRDLISQRVLTTIQEAYDSSQQGRRSWQR